MAAVGIGELGVGPATIIACVCVCCCCYWLMACVIQCGRGVEVYAKGLHDGLGFTI